MTGSINIYCGNTTLADGQRGVGIVESLTINGNAVVQDGGYVDAAWMEFIDLANKSNQIELRVSKEHASSAACLAHLARIRETIPGVADFLLEYEDSEGGVNVQGLGAAWRGTRASHKGRSSFVDYSIETGRLAITETGGDDEENPTPFLLPAITIASINPLTIPANTLAAISSGEVLFVFGLDVRGELRVPADARLQVSVL